MLNSLRWISSLYPHTAGIQSISFWLVFIQNDHPHIRIPKRELNLEIGVKLDRVQGNQWKGLVSPFHFLDPWNPTRTHPHIRSPQGLAVNHPSILIVVIQSEFSWVNSPMGC
ncbi:hypothetical protein KQX54_018337 [Cotesia glomerata]|uniref:Uncharacterized protein n=1 Tax=Cotesia glomerata TaxID=32391 RepID=A0AAV7IAL5_COTGL|nr:hypothetical protein KQX54_018337 [Cotesia glomerata]